jgi:hypothetical protein
LADALGGTWQSRENKLKIFIDTKNNSWTITNAQGQQSKQKWEPQNKSGNHMTFFNNGGKAIDARLRSDGVLVMSGRGKPVDFVFLDNGREYRTCPNCYCKTEIEISICKHCCKEFR